MIAKNTLYKLLLTVLVMVLCTDAQAQKNTGRNNKNNTVQESPQESVSEEFASGLVKLTQLARRIDSLNNEASKARESLVSDARNKEAYTERIIDAESGIFSARDELKRLTERMEAIERDYPEVAAALNEKIAAKDEASSQTPIRQYKYLVRNDFIRDALSESDYANLLHAQEAERDIYTTLKRVLDNYDTMAELYADYQNVINQKDADILYEGIMDLHNSNLNLIDDITQTWEEVFDTKTYTYNYILDKLNDYEHLAQIEQRMQNMQQSELGIKGVYMYDDIAAYPLRKRMLLDYESVIAAKGNISQATDSLSKVNAALKPERYMMPKFDLTERLFIDYENIEIVKTARYNSSNPIPKCTIYPKGTIYRILIASYTRQQPVSAFKNVVPLSWEYKSDKRYYYYAGGFTTYDEAEKGLEAVKKAGFEKASVVVWQNGEYISDNVSTVNNSNTRSSSQSATAQYRIEITVKGALPQFVRDIIAERAEGKELTRTPGKQGGEAVFSLGLFDSKVLAESIANEMISAGSSADIAVREVE